MSNVVYTSIIKQTCVNKIFVKICAVVIHVSYKVVYVFFNLY